MLILGGSYHCGFNFGYNIAEAVNYATLSWLQKLVKCQSCSCSKNSVRASHREILNNLLSSTYEYNLGKYSTSQEVLALEKNVM